MQITVTFDSLEEFRAHMKTSPSQKRVQVMIGDTNITPAVVEDKPKATPAEDNPVEEPAPAAAPVEDKPTVTEDFRTEVRKTLAQLNKHSGSNMAKELIQSFGKERLTDVPLSDLPALMEKAKEALDAK